jgi:hypothetical protein
MTKGHTYFISVYISSFVFVRSQVLIFALESFCCEMFMLFFIDPGLVPQNMPHLHPSQFINMATPSYLY